MLDDPTQTHDDLVNLTAINAVLGYNLGSRQSTIEVGSHVMHKTPVELTLGSSRTGRLSDHTVRSRLTLARNGHLGASFTRDWRLHLSLISFRDFSPVLNRLWLSSLSVPNPLASNGGYLFAIKSTGMKIIAAWSHSIARFDPEPLRHIKVKWVNALFKYLPHKSIRAVFIDRPIERRVNIACVGSISLMLRNTSRETTSGLTNVALPGYLV